MKTKYATEAPKIWGKILPNDQVEARRE